MSEKETSKKLTVSVIILIILSVALCITTFALVWATASVDNNMFHTGIVKINLNDGKPIIEEHELLFEPGITVKKDFFIENQSTDDVYYKLYFGDIDGLLADVLEITIMDGDRILYSGLIKELTKRNVGVVDEALKVNEKKNLTVCFHFPEDVGNSAQNLYLSFSMNADAVQTKNNPNRVFD